MQQPVTEPHIASWVFFLWIYVRRNYLYNNRCLFFCRLKINHEPHEIILESGTVANRKTAGLGQEIASWGQQRNDQLPVAFFRGVDWVPVPQFLVDELQRCTGRLLSRGRSAPRVAGSRALAGLTREFSGPTVRTGPFDLMSLSISYTYSVNCWFSHTHILTFNQVKGDYKLLSGIAKNYVIFSILKKLII